jgi:membrane-associated protein
MGFFFVTVGVFVKWLAIHRAIAYNILFLGAYFEVLIFTCWFIPGELFFYSGSILAGAHVLYLPWVALALYSGALLGDSTNYAIGRYAQLSIFKENSKFMHPKFSKKIEQLFQRHGPKAVFVGRLLGPIAWITPVFAGAYGMKYKTFIKYNVPGVLIGVGELIAVGYFFGNRYQVALWLIERYSILIFILASAAFLFYLQHKKSSKKKNLL